MSKLVQNKSARWRQTDRLRVESYFHLDWFPSGLWCSFKVAQYTWGVHVTLLLVPCFLSLNMLKRLCQPCWSPGHWAAVFALAPSLLNSIIILLVLVCVKCLQSQADNPKKGMSEKQKIQVNYPCGDVCHFSYPDFFNTSHLFYLTSC